MKRQKRTGINSETYRNMIERYKDERWTPEEYGMKVVGSSRFTAINGSGHEHEMFDWESEPLQCGKCILVYLYNKYESIVAMAEEIGITKASVWNWMMHEGVHIKRHAEVSH
jgi:hypothetical protein